MSIMRSPRLFLATKIIARRARWLVLLVIVSLAAQTTPAMACHEDWSAWHIAVDPGGYAFCQFVFKHFDSSGKGQEPVDGGGFNAPIPDDTSRANLPDPSEKRCFPKPTCQPGYRTFCVNPVAAAPACCHAWRVCEKKF